MTPQALKRSILQQAMQGKLVEQRPEEGTGKKLYQHLQAEKQRLIYEGKLKKGKALPAITEAEIPFAIPDTWKWVRWGSLSLSIQYGFNAPAKPYGRIKMVRISDIQAGQVAWDAVPFCDISEELIPNYLLSKDDILFARTGSVGKSFLVRDMPVDAIYAGYLIRTKYSNELCPEYLLYFMNSPLYWEQLRKGTTATVQPNCNGQTLSQMIVPLPPLAEQKRIAAKIEALLSLVDRYAVAYDKLERLNAKFPDEIRKSILQYAVQGKLVPQLSSETPVAPLGTPIDKVPFAIPASWQWVMLQDLSEKISDGTHNPPPDAGQGIPLLSAKNINNGQIDFSSVSRWVSVEQWEQENKRADISAGCVLLTIVGTIGRTAVVNNDCERFMLQRSVCVIKNKPVLNSQYLALILQSSSLSQWLNDRAAGTAQKGVYLRTIKKLPIPLPPLAEQKRIVARVNELLALVEQLPAS